MVWTNPYGAVETAADLPKFCGKCGRPMRDDSHATGYSRLNGAPLVAIAVRCPKGRFDSGHEAFIVSRRPPPSPPPGLPSGRQPARPIPAPPATTMEEP